MQDAGEGFTRWINVERLGRDPIVFDISASEAECADLVQRLGIVEMSGLAVTGSVSRKSEKNRIELAGKVKTDIVQSCVVSLEPVAQKIEEKFAVCYTFDKEDVIVEEVDYVATLEEDDLPEFISDGRIDVVQAIVEQIALALDPYPRADNAENTKNAGVLRDAKKAVETSEPEVHKPFANLRELMNKK